MSLDSRRQSLKVLKQRNYLVKEFEDFYRDLQDFARTYYPTKFGKDTSENSLGGALLEFAARVGDVQSFYLDHQFHETSPLTAIETRNIERHLADNGVDIIGASPAVCSPRFYIKVPVEANSNPPVPDPTALPIIHAGTTVPASNGVLFELVEDLDFSDKNTDESYKATVIIGDTDDVNFPTNYIMSLDGLCISGQRQVDTFDVGSFEAFKQFTLTKENVTEIISVKDSLGNSYYEVQFLTQDTVFKSVLNKNDDNDMVKETLEIIPAPYRFIKKTSLNTRLTTLTFGGGSSETLNDDIIPDPSEFAVPLYGKTTFPRFTINPGKLLETTTLGTIAPNTTLTVEYRYGGGLSHNVEPDSIQGVDTLRMSFPNNAANNVASFVRGSIDVVNQNVASGGDDPPTVDELKQQIPAQRSAQSRIVSREDTLAFIYKMPPNFGRVYRASIRSNPNNPLAARLYIVCRNKDKQLTIAPDALKKNLALFLNQHRMISDAIDILDAKVINLQLEYTIVVDPTITNKQLILQNVSSKLSDFLSKKDFDIDEPISISEIENNIFNNQGVISIQDVKFRNITGTVGSRVYSDIQFDVTANTDRKIIFGTPGSIFEIRYKENDIIGTYV